MQPKYVGWHRQMPLVLHLDGGLQSDNRIATEVCRLESRAAEINTQQSNLESTV